jgi:hypothetical protein
MSGRQQEKAAVGGSAARDGRGVGRMEKRRTRLEDGRYLIYYTFGEGEPARAGGREGDEGTSSQVESGAEPEAAEERSV